MIADSLCFVLSSDLRFVWGGQVGYQAWLLVCTLEAVGTFFRILFLQQVAHTEGKRPSKDKTSGCLGSEV